MFQAIPMWLKVGGPLLGLAWLRGKTGQLSAFQSSHAKQAALVLCESGLADIPPGFQTPQAMAKIIAETAYTVDRDGNPKTFDWPPRYLADKSHKQVWAQLVQWCTTIKEVAEASGFTVCEYLAAGEIPPIPPIPGEVDQGPLIPAEPGPEPSDPFEPDILGPGSTQPPTDPGLIPGLQPPSGPQMPMPPASSPTPGQSYQITMGDTFLGNVGQAYGLPSGAERYQASLAVAAHPINKAVVDYYFGAPGSNEAGMYPQGRPSYNPPYQVIYFPEL